MTGMFLLMSMAAADPGALSSFGIEALLDDDEFTRVRPAIDASIGRVSNIVNGTETNDYPQVVALAGMSQWDAYVWCSGTLIDANFVLTAAHCVDNVAYVQSIGMTPYILFGGDLYGAGFTDAIEIISYVEHPNYDGDQLLNDIGIIEMGTSATGINLAVLNDEPVNSSWVGLDMTFLGFGVTSDDGAGSGTKRITDLEVVDYDSQFIITYSNGTNLCSGDSGGPGFENTSYGTQELAGVNSFVWDGCVGGGAGVTRVDQHIAWIQGFAPGVLLGGSGEGSNPGTGGGDGETSGGGPAEDANASGYDKEFADPLTPSKGAFPVGLGCSSVASVPSGFAAIWTIPGLLLIIRRKHKA